MIEKATTKDIDELSILNEELFGESRDYTEEINSDNTEVYVYRKDHKIIGISGIKKNDWNGTGWLLNIFVHPDYRKQGIASNLVKKMIDISKENGLRCLVAEAPSESNAPMLFNSLGFRKCGYNDRYYSNKPGEIAEFWSYDI